MRKGILKKVSALVLALTMVVTMVPTAYANTDESVSIGEEIEVEAVEVEESSVEVEEENTAEVMEEESTAEVVEMEETVLNPISEPVEEITNISTSEILDESIVAQNEGIVVTNISLSKATLELTDTILNDSLTITLEATGADENTVLYLDFDNQVGLGNYQDYINNVQLNYQNGVYVGQITVGYNYGYNTGIYVLSNVHTDTIQSIDYENELQFAYSKKNTDHTAPLINSVKLFNEEGNEITAGQSVKRTDGIIVKADITDASSLVGLAARIADVGSYGSSRALIYEEETGLYTTTFTLEEFVGTLCYVEINASDVYYNQTQKSYKDTLYFMIENESGEEPEITYTVTFHMGSGVPETYTVTGRGSISFNELFPAGVPEAPVYEGVTFEGWKVDGIGIVTEGEEFVPNGTELRVYPAYDKTQVGIQTNYLRDELSINTVTTPGFNAHSTTMIFADKGDTVEDIFEKYIANTYPQIDVNAFPHSSKLQFEGWKLLQNTTMQGNTVPEIYDNILINAVYDKAVIGVDLQYINEDGKLVATENGGYGSISNVVIVDKTMTVKQFIDSYRPDGISHMEGLNLVGWESLYPIDENQLIGEIVALQLIAIYDKAYVQVDYKYFDKNGNVVVESKPLVVEQGEYTYDELMALTSIPTIEHTDKLGKFVKWDTYYRKPTIYGNYEEAVVSKDTVITNGYIMHAAVYENRGVSVDYHYIDKDLNLIVGTELLKIDEGQDADTVVNAFASAINVEHADEMEYQGYWNCKSDGVAMGEIPYWNDMGMPKWLVTPEYKNQMIKFHAEGGSNLSQDYKIVEKFSKVGTLPTVEREDYEFEGWFTSVAIYPATSDVSFSPYEMKVDLFAKWKPLYNKLTIKDIVLSSDILELNDEAYSASIDISLSAACVEEDTVFHVVYANKDGYDLETDLIYQDGKYVGTIEVNFSNLLEEGEYVLKKITVNDEVVASEYTEISKFTLVKNNTDKEAPVITEVKLYDHAGNELMDGMEIPSASDVVAKVKVEDTSEISTVWIHFEDKSEYKELFLEFNDTTGYYEGTLALIDFAVGKWDVKVGAQDIYLNSTSRIELSLEIAAEVAPIVTYNVSFYMGDISATPESFTVTGKDVTSFKELFPEGIPEAPVYEGVNFVGWKVDGIGVVEEDEKFVPHGTELRVYPAYDKTQVYIQINYLKDELSVNTVMTPGYNANLVTMVFVDKGDTVKDISEKFAANAYSEFDINTISHSSKLQLEGWKLWQETTMQGNEIPEINDNILINAIYDNAVVGVDLQYINEDGELVSTQNPTAGRTFDAVIVDKNTTFKEFVDNYQTDKISHLSELNLIGWEPIYKPVDENQLISDNSIVYLNAIYDKAYIQVEYKYYNENGEAIVDSQYLCVEKDEYAYDEIEALTTTPEIKHTDKLGNFVKWNIYYQKPTSYGGYEEILVNDDTIITNGYITHVAEYEKQGASVNYGYFDQNLDWISKTELLEIPDDTDKYTVVQKFISSLKSIEHAKEMEYQGYWISRIDSMSSSNTYEVSKTILIPDYKNAMVIFHANGGENLSEEYRILPKYEKLGELPTVERDGYDFLGWFTMIEKGNQMTSHTPVLDIKVDLYAQWKQVDVPVEKPEEDPDTKPEEKPEEMPNTKPEEKPEETPNAGLIPSIPAPEQSQKPEKEDKEEKEHKEKEDKKDKKDENDHREDDRESNNKEEKPKKPAEKLEKEKVDKVVEEIEEIEDGDTVVIDMKKEDGKTATEVPVEVLEAAKGKNIKIELDMGDYKWTIHGKNIQGVDLKAIDLEVTFDNLVIEEVKIKEKAGEDYCRQISLTHNGEFGFKASLTINVGKEHKGSYGNLYYYNKEGILEFMNAGLIDENGNVNLDFNHASDYVVVVGRDRTEEEAVNQEVVEENVSDTGVVDDATSGSSLPIVPIIVVIAILAVVAVAVMKKKK